MTDTRVDPPPRYPDPKLRKALAARAVIDARKRAEANDTTSKEERS